MLDDVCARGNHLAPATGGTCPCGMVTRVPAVRPAPAQDTTAPETTSQDLSLHDPAVRDLIARCLVERGGLADLPDLRRRADRVLGALTEAGLLLTRRPAAEAAERRSA